MNYLCGLYFGSKGGDEVVEMLIEVEVVKKVV